MLDLLRTSFVPVAVDVNEIQHRSGPAGDFYREVVLQRSGMRLERTTQGHYVLTPAGELLTSNNHRDPAMLVRHLRAALRRFDVAEPSGEVPEPFPDDQPRPPAGTTVIEVFTRVLEADWPESKSEEERAVRSALGRDFLWITADERGARC